ncbi:MAG: protein kinase [Clostridiales bacterium]|nr:protein kinase [Clostridiales bacterium]
MEFVTEQKNILHLDIKPENIMVTRYGKELVLIDFGRSKRVTVADRFAVSNLSPVDYTKEETQEKQYEYGALGYAAPECYCDAEDGLTFPFAQTSNQGKMSIESDIFSFGATFWECLNMFELITKNNSSNFDIYDFYKEYFLNDEAYCNRDLSLTTPTYHQRLEKIIKKCTRKRSQDYTTSDKYYHSYKDLRKDIEFVKDSVPTIVKEEDVKVRTPFKLCGIMVALTVVFLIINSVYHLRAFTIAENKWNNLTETYNATQFSELSVIAKDYLSSAAKNQVDETYDKIVKFTYQENGFISDYEAVLLVELLSQMNESEKLPERVDEIMMHADTSNFKAISSEIVKLEVPKESIGYELATAIYNVEVSKTNVVEAYETLVKNKDNIVFRFAVLKLKNVLDNDENIKLIMESKDQTREEILSFFNVITNVFGE